MATYIKLKQTPLKEIILTISFKENVEISKLEMFKSLPEISTYFPVVNSGFHTLLNDRKNETPTANVSVDGFILKSNSKDEIIQARRGSFSLHKVNKYETFENLITELQTYWNLLEQCCGQLTVNALTVRYLNFIGLNNNENPDDFINIHVKHPFGENAKNSFTQHKFKCNEDISVDASIVSFFGKIDNMDRKEGIILDIILNKSVEIDSEGQLFNFENFNIMRSIKNNIFFKCITEKTINKYNQ